MLPTALSAGPTVAQTMEVHFGSTDALLYSQLRDRYLAPAAILQVNHP
jgi:hypothetical protein